MPSQNYTAPTEEEKAVECARAWEEYRRTWNSSTGTFESRGNLFWVDQSLLSVEMPAGRSESASIPRSYPAERSELEEIRKVSSQYISLPSFIGGWLNKRSALSTSEMKSDATEQTQAREGDDKIPVEEKTKDASVAATK